MGAAIGSSVVTAVGIALSPMAIIAVVLMLITRHPRSNGLSFVVGWLLALGVVGAAVLVIAGPTSAGQHQSATWSAWVDLALGLALVVVAVRRFRKRPRGEREPSLPRWMGTVERCRPPEALALGAGLAGANPKNLLLAVAGAAEIAQTGISGGQQALAYTVFALIATVGVAAPLVLYLALGRRSAPALTRLKDWMARNNAVIIAVLCLVIGAKLIGDAIGAATG
ncbi:MAG TPA: GAP family protein [Acidimicrobiales bacterium]|jgi:Kef-type K+ transport system membrane component KefB|nr:GAP family protein [Acidimicrobiales bacterium]